MRLDKYLTQCSELTRSLAGVAIRQGRVRVNDKVIKSSSLKINTQDTVLLNGQALKDKIGPRYFMLHKPAGYICANSDEQHEVVFTLLTNEINLHKLHTVGRLDLDTTGLVLISDDGPWSHAITSPKHHQTKAYRVWLSEPLIADAEQQVATGIMLRDEKYPTKPGTLERISATEVILTISEGRYHQVKRMFAALGNRVIKLHRQSVGGVCLDDNLQAGQYRALTPQEISRLGKASS
ncbi:MAG: 16S rRNA pseudouridine(516) synthase RsuA [Bermanella sp.]